MDASFIIVNYNSFNNVKNLIDSKYKIFTFLKNETIIIDNNSKEREIEKLPHQYSEIRLYNLKLNIGFSRANNFAVEKSSAEYIVFVNPDVLFIEDCITPIIDFIEKNENAGACGPMLLNKDLSIQNSTGFKMGLTYDFVEAFFLISLFRKIFNFKYKLADKNKGPFSVAWLSAALLVIKREVFEKIGGFDPDFFLNYEDIDLCRRLQKNGYKNYYFHNLKCIHFSNQSFKSDYELLVASRYKSRRIYAKKHYSVLTRNLVWLIHVSGLFLRLSTVHFLYSGTERKQRYNGYKLSLKSYFSRFTA